MLNTSRALIRIHNLILISWLLNEHKWILRPKPVDSELAVTKCTEKDNTHLTCEENIVLNSHKNHEEKRQC